MTAVTFKDNSVVMRGDLVGTEQACCCCTCPAGCVDGLQISLGGTPSCAGGYYFDAIPCTFGSISASMYCLNGTWFVSVSVCCFENEGVCTVVYEAQLPCEEDSLPPAGVVTLTQVYFNEIDNGCPPLPPVVTISK